MIRESIMLLHFFESNWVGVFVLIGTISAITASLIQVIKAFYRPYFNRRILDTWDDQHLQSSLQLINWNAKVPFDLPPMDFIGLLESVINAHLATPKGKGNELRSFLRGDSENTNSDDIELFTGERPKRSGPDFEAYAEAGLRLRDRVKSIFEIIRVVEAQRWRRDLLITGFLINAVLVYLPSKFMFGEETIDAIAISIGGAVLAPVSRDIVKAIEYARGHGQRLNQR